jgi:hypothetical protein
VVPIMMPVTGGVRAEGSDTSRLSALVMPLVTSGVVGVFTA